MTPGEKRDPKVDPTGTTVADVTGSAAFGATIAATPAGTGAASVAAAVATESAERPIGADAEALGPFGPFTRVELLNEQGAMGTVARGYHEGFDRWELLKFIRADLMHQPEVVRQFFREGRVLAKLSHQNVVQVFALYSYGGRPCLAMEFLEGQSLQALAEQAGGKLPIGRWHELFLAAARGLAAAHDVGLLHRDLKPENLFVANDRAGAPGGLKLIDFGLAAADRSRRDGPEPDAFMMAPNSGGTPLYMAPELWQGDDSSPRTDIYALGLSFFAVLTGRLPFPVADSIHELCVQLMAPEPFPDPRELRHDLPSPLALVLRRATAKRKEERFASADELVAALVAAANAARTRRVPGSGPYRGLGSYGASERDVFFGREAEIAEVLERLRWQAGVVLVGPSGSGKSSLAQAGVLPAVEEGALGGGVAYGAVLLAPRVRPCHSLAVALARKLDLPEKDVVSFLRARPGSLGEALRSALPAGAGVVLLVDQLEELATVADDPAEVRDFAAAIASLIDVASSPVRVVATLRADRMDRLFAIEPLRPLLTRGFHPVRPLAGEALRRVVVEPALTAGYRLEDLRLVDGIVADVAQRPEALPLLSFAMASWWEARDEASHTLPASAWVAMGGLAGALTRHGDRVLDAMGEEERRAAEQILVRLVSADRTRASVPRTSLLDPAAASTATARALDRLVEAKLANESAGQIDLAHETLITQWPLLRGLLASSGDDRAFRERVAAAARQWDAQRRPDGALWTGDQAQRLERWFEATGASLDQSELAFVEAVLRRARRALWLRRTATGAVVLVALTTGLVAVASERAMRKRLDATNARLSESRAAYAHAEASRLEALARSEVEYDPSAALRHAATSYDLEHAPGLDVIAWAARSRGVGVVLPSLGGAVSLVRFSPDDAWLAAVTGGRIAVLATRGRETASLHGAADRAAVVEALAFWEHGRLAYGTSDGELAIADAPSFVARSVARGLGDVRAIEWHGGGRVFASCRDAFGATRSIAIDVTTGDVQPGQEAIDAIEPVAFAADGVARVRREGSAVPWTFEVGAPAYAIARERNAVALVGREGEILIVSLATGDLLGRIPTARAITSVGAPGRGDRLVAGTRDGTLLSFDLPIASASVARRALDHAAQVAAVSPGGAVFVADHGSVTRIGGATVALLASSTSLAAGDERVALAGQSADGRPAVALAPSDLASSSPPIVLASPATALAWSRDGRTLYVAGDDRRVREIDAVSLASTEVAALAGAVAAGDTIRALSPFDDGKAMAVGTAGGSLLVAPLAVASPSGGGAATQLVAFRAPVTCLGVAQGGRAVVAAVGREATVVDTTSGVPFLLWRAPAPVAGCVRAPFEDRFRFVDTGAMAWSKDLDLAGVSMSYVPPDPDAHSTLPALAAWTGLPRTTDQ